FSRAIRPAKSGVCSAIALMAVWFIVSLLLLLSFYRVAPSLNQKGSGLRNDLPRIQDIVRVKGPLQARHEVKRVLPMLGQHELHFVQAHPMLARARALHAYGPLDQAPVELLGFG